MIRWWGGISISLIESATIEIIGKPKKFELQLAVRNMIYIPMYNREKELAMG